MYKTFKAMLIIIWILDVCNFPQLAFLDTSFPVNGLAWFLGWALLPPTITRTTIIETRDTKENDGWEE